MNDENNVDISNRIKLVGNYYFNTFVLKGNNACAIVETGVSATVDHLISQLEKMECPPDYIIVTHPHADHVTGLDGLMTAFPHAQVIMGKGAGKFIEHPKAGQAMFYEDKYISQILHEKGIKPGRPPLTSIPDLSDCVVVNETLQIDLGGLLIECMGVKGHAPGNIAVNVPEEDTLLISDSLGFYYPGRGFCPLYFTGLGDYVESINFFKSLNPRVIGPGHQGVILGDDVDAAFEASLSATKEVVKLSINIDKTIDALARELFDRYYREEFKLYSTENIMNCMGLIVRRAREFCEEKKNLDALFN